jgi:hypothetical protein
LGDIFQLVVRQIESLEARHILYTANRHSFDFVLAQIQVAESPEASNRFGEVENKVEGVMDCAEVLLQITQFVGHLPQLTIPDIQNLPGKRKEVQRFCQQAVVRA